MTTQFLADGESAAAGLTVGIAVYAAVILAALGTAVVSIQQRRRGRALAAALVVAVLTIAGVVVAIVSSIA